MQRTQLVSILVIGGVVTAIAQASSWSNFEPAFPANPCQDGWMACLVDGEAVTPDLRLDTKGLPIPSDLRIGWHDLEPTPVFSPFSGLSAYTGELPEIAANNDGLEEDDEEYVAEDDEEYVEEDDEEYVAEDDEEYVEEDDEEYVEEEYVPPPSEERVENRRAADPTPVEADDGQAQRDAEQARARQEAEEREERDQARRDRQAQAQRDNDANAVADAEARAAEERRAQRAAERAERRDQAEADERARKQAEAKSTSTKSQGDGVAIMSRPTKPAVQDDSCNDLIKLEGPAMLGKLRAGQLQCLEASLNSELAKGTSASQTHMGKISKVLVLNYYGSGNTREWERVVARHLTDIDSSDPDLCYMYAIKLNGKQHYQSVIKWADIALENSAVWQGSKFVSRMSTLLKLKTNAAQKLWEKAETNYATNPSAALRERKENARGLTKNFAREWYDYAKKVKKDPTQALQICISAAGTQDYCEGQ